jgi:hypothetical protein
MDDMSSQHKLKLKGLVTVSPHLFTNYFVGNPNQKQVHPTQLLGGSLH